MDQLNRIENIGRWIDAGFDQDRTLEQSRDEKAGTESAPSAPSRMSQAARLLRWIGAATLAASAIVFVSQRWDQMDSVLRYYSFLGFTGALAAVGLFCGLVMKEAKGARTLLALSAAFLPAHFAQIGALIHSQFGDIFPRAGSMLILTAPDRHAPFVVLAVALAILLPIAYLGFSSMARAAAPALTAMFLLSNAALLIPIREPNFAALIGAGLFCLMLMGDRLLFSSNSALKTWDGRAVRALLFVPIAVLAVRNILSYQLTAMFCAFLFGSIGVILDQAVPTVVGGAPGRLSRRAGAVLLAIAWYQFLDGLLFGSNALFSRFGSGLDAGFYIPLQILPISALLLYRSLRLGAEAGKGCWFAAVLAVGSSIINLIVVGGLVASFICLVVSILAVVGAFTTESLTIFYTGIWGIAASLLFYMRFAWQLAEASPWLALALLGTAIVLFSSYIERNHRRIFERVRKFRVLTEDWS